MRIVVVESWGKKDVRRKENKPLLLGTTKARDNGEATRSRFVEEAAIPFRNSLGGIVKVYSSRR